MRLLVDMDSVLADWEKGFLEIWRELYPDRPHIPLEQRTTFSPKDQYPPEYRESIVAIQHAPGFFQSLEPIPGGLEAIQTIHDLGHEVFICTSPLSNYRHCVLEKYEWVDQHLGKEWVRRIILTKDKTLIRADCLIDDKPVIAGVDVPCWEHILYDQPYNRSETQKRRLTWQNWRSVLSL
jgi:5'-nucleotidase